MRPRPLLGPDRPTAGSDEESESAGEEVASDDEVEFLTDEPVSVVKLVVEHDII